MEALAAVPVDCPVQYKPIPWFVPVCGEFPEEKLGFVKSTVDGIVLGDSPAIPASTPGEWSREKKTLFRKYRLGEIPIHVIVDLKSRIVVVSYPQQSDGCLETRQAVPEDRLPDMTPPVAQGDHPPSVKYPELARVARLEGTVLLQAMITKDGAAGEVCVLRIDRPNMGFEEAAIDGVRKWPFEPATLGGEPIDFPVQVNLHFRLRLR